MQEQYHQIGESAGRVWNALEKGGELTLTQLQKEAKITETALFHQAIGWLAREEKIQFQKSGKNTRVSISTSNV